MSNRYSGGYSVGDHLFPFRTEKLSPTAPMVLHTRGRVGRRQLFLQASFNRFVERGFFLCVSFFWGASSPGGDASPRRYCQVGVRSPNLAMRKCIVFAWQGIEPCQANADAGTRRPQVRTRFPQVRTRFLLAMKKVNDRLTKKINDRLMMINVQKKKTREASLSIILSIIRFTRALASNIDLKCFAKCEKFSFFI